MRILIGILIFPLLLHADAESLFHQATVHYNEGNFQKALEAYQDIEAVSPELDYNIANTLMKLDRPAEAIARYRRAQWLKPGDADIQANLKLAVEQADAPLPEIPLLRSLTGWWTPATWQRIFILTCWLTAGLGFLTTVIPRVRALAFWTVPPMLLLLGCAAVGTWASLPSNFTSEAVIKSPEAITRFEPLPDATEKRNVSRGTLVTVLGTERNWIRIQTDEDTGWIKEEELVRL